jgi:transposase
MTGKYLTSFQRKLLEKNLEKAETYLSDNLRKRIQIMLYADEGRSQAEICQILKCSAATARAWILQAQSGMAHQWQEHPRGRPATIKEEHLARLKELVNTSPRELGECFDEWTGYSLSRRLTKEFGITVTRHHINRLVKRLNSDDEISVSQNFNNADSSYPDRISIRDLPFNQPV